MQIFEPYIPKKFGKEYVEICTSSQYPMFVLVSLGIKPSYDDWVPCGRFEEFVEVCSKYGLYAEPDVVFLPANNDKTSLIGKENIATTFSSAKRFDKNDKEGKVHVFVAKKREKAIEAKKHGWYPVIIQNRSTNKPFIDHLRFGKALGFPDCCIDSFRKYNNWALYSHPFESYKNTRKSKGKSLGSYYCNNFLMDKTYFLIHHIPCTYNCKKTIEYAKKAEAAISDVEPEYIEKIKILLKKPLLVFGERHFIIFDGKLIGNELGYFRCEYFSNPAKPEEKIDFLGDIIKSDKIIDKGDFLFLYCRDQHVSKIRKEKKWFLIGFD